MPTGDVELTIVDGGSRIVVPAQSVQVVMGCSSSGTVGQIVATKSPQTLSSTFGSGPLPEAAALACLAGGTVLAVRTTSNAAGSATAVTFSGTGTSVITVTGTPNDDYYVFFKCVAGGTRGTAGITFQISLDAGRNFGPVISLGTATTYVITGTGITLNFAAGTLVAGDTAKFGCTAPAWNAAGVQVALNALLASPYAITGWGSAHLVGVAAASDVATIQGYLDTLATGYLFTRLMMSARDASPVAAYGGTGESESTWISSLQTAFAATSAKRSCVAAGYYNTPTAFPLALAGAPSYRRPLQWAHAARAVQIPPQRHSGRVKDGALSNIVIDPANDPTDGFVYHDERLNPGLDAARFTSARTRIGLPGLYIANPNLMAPVGSDFSILPYGNVMDVACGIVHQVGQQVINSDVRLNKNGTLYENDARGIETALTNAINIAMTSQAMISSVTVVVDRTTNVGTLKKVVVTVTIVARGYVLEEDVTIGFANALAA